MLLLNKWMILVSVILFLLCMAMPLRKAKGMRGRKTVQALLRPHAWYALLLLITSLVHGIMAGKHPTMISGKLAWMVLLVVLLTSVFQKSMKSKNWRKLHQIVSILCAFLIVVHIVQAIVS